MKQLAALLTLLVAGPATAGCGEEVAGLYRGGALDPLARPNRVERVQGLWPDGRIEWAYEITYDGPFRELHCGADGCVLIASEASWHGDGPEGPWRDRTVWLSDAERAEYLRREAEGFAAGISQAHCEDSVLDGREARLYRYHARSQTGVASWSEGDYSVWVETETGWTLRVEEANAMRAAAPDPREYLWLTLIENDPEIAISVPEE